MKILKKGGVVEKRGEEETKSMPHAPVKTCTSSFITVAGEIRNKYRPVTDFVKVVKMLAHAQRP